MTRILAFLFAVFAAIHVSAQQLSVAAAADLNFALHEIAAKYQQQTGNTLNIAYGSSGNFFTQIQNGAPFDVFLSADRGYPRQLEAAGLAQPGTLFNYALGRIVLWVPNGSKLDLSRGTNVLMDPSINKIAIANPRHAPYGRAAEAALRKAGLYDRIQSKLVFGENISQTAQFVETGNADIGIIAMSLASAPTLARRGRYVEVPSDLYPPLEQAAVVLKSSNNKHMAEQFLDFLKQPETKMIFKKYGF